MMKGAMLYGDLSLLSVFLWHITFVYLIVLIVLSYIIYRNNRDKIFLYYFIYVFLLFTYIVCRNYYFREIQTYRSVYLYSYYVQVLYLCVYFHFGLLFINFKIYFPNFTKWLYRYLALALGIGTLIFIAGLSGWVHSSSMVDYYHKYFYPVHISFAIVIIYRAIQLKQERLRVYFLIGTISYLILGTVAVLTSFYQPAGFMVRPIAYFYIAIIIECTFFAIGLGLRIRYIYTGKLETERQLNAAQKELQIQMQRQIEQQEEDKKALQREKELQTLATQVALLENRVLHSQMNSHFIFNVLNSIKAYIIEKNVAKAVTYLNKFSKLIRWVLEASRNENYTFADEISAIRLYVDIEKMRVSDNLTSVVNIDIQQNPETIPFPPLLIQPFVENAIWHGLMPSHREKKLSIQVFNIDTDILIEIIDNGIGYSNSLREKKILDTHRSHGMDITKERIDQFNKKNKLQISFGIKDRADAIGTRVWIRIDMHYLYSK